MNLGKQDFISNSKILYDPDFHFRQVFWDVNCSTVISLTSTEVFLFLCKRKVCASLQLKCPFASSFKCAPMQKDTQTLMWMETAKYLIPEAILNLIIWQSQHQSANGIISIH